LLGQFERIDKGKLKIEEGVTFNWPAMIFVIFRAFQDVAMYKKLSFARAI